MAGFRIGRGRDSRNARQHGQRPPQGAPPGPPQGQGPGQGPYGRGPGPGPGQGPGPGRGPGPGPGPYGPGQPQPQPPYGQQGWPPAGNGPGGPGGGQYDEPEYFGDPYAPQGGGRADPYSNNAGHTQAFSIHDPYAPQGDGYGDGYSDGAVYTTGDGPGPPPGPRLHWKDLLRGIVLRPNPTFLQMRDYPVWGPALVTTFLYGLLAVFGLDDSRETVLDATLTSALQYVIAAGIAITVMGVILGAVTHTLARQFGGNGLWAPTIGLSMLIMSLSDTPRLIFAMFLGGTAPLVQVLGWMTWLGAGALFTLMVSRSHELPWQKALGASAIQLLALLFLVKLGTL
ncbi:YIP1 family protein [Streptomyces sp. N2-109]|uniref:YIP1 family protein n=1 Tax=Streptomyces gossypii TaxID=2883101 RepID=A0ABT2JPJ1_9ACTN|nr:Yip1 family protein [Streptomyces gossypii]MCT2589661.1 YIP1 family protein [Streptomyces gossypii]